MLNVPLLLVLLHSHVGVGTTALDEYVSESFLRAHNKIRQRHKLPDYKWNESLGLEARRIAMNLSDICYGGTSFPGINVSQSFGSRPVSLGQVVHDWYSNRCIDRSSCHGYNNILSSTVKMIGCSYAFCRDAGSYAVSGLYVCIYDPLVLGK